jgi:hypothetical protein
MTPLSQKFSFDNLSFKAFASKSLGSKVHPSLDWFDCLFKGNESI